MGPTFLVFLKVLFLKKKKGNPAVPGEGRRLGSFATVMDALAQAWNGKGAGDDSYDGDVEERPDASWTCRG